jgi:hypothetical protein
MLVAHSARVACSVGVSCVLSHLKNAVGCDGAALTRCAGRCLKLLTRSPEVERRGDDLVQLLLA